MRHRPRAPSSSGRRITEATTRKAVEQRRPWRTTTPFDSEPPVVFAENTMPEQPDVDLNKLSDSQKRALAHAFLDRPRIHPEMAMTRLRRSYPNTAEPILNVQRFHLVTELPDALRDFLAEMELYW